jgi:hypothetical protein
MGSQKPIRSPTTPKQVQQTRIITRMVMIQGLIFLGALSGEGGGLPVVSLKD